MHCLLQIVNSEKMGLSFIDEDYKIYKLLSISQFGIQYLVDFDYFHEFKNILLNFKISDLLLITKFKENHLNSQQITVQPIGMPKIIDNYILEQKIGSGQFGDVYKGFNQQTNLEVAIKTIKRQTIKGKFYQLLQNEIKVLKTCDNPYIMKLYALKKTANHYYLILEFCNGGDMLGKMKKMKRLEENLVIKYLCQILTGFQTLVKHKIMHRDFKLANILLHDDNIKIADFGFSKLLNQQDYTSTMLGSPLNMAPEVLGGNKYNNKADIWSIGACIYEMLYGKPPYMASNMVDLLKNINTKPLNYPSQIKVNPTLLDVLKKMLIPDVKKRISWNDLFSHPINRYLDSLVRKQIDLELIEDQSLMINTSKYYLKKNLVINKPEDIEQKAKVNEELFGIIKTGEKVKTQTNEVQNAETNTKNFTKHKPLHTQTQVQQKNQSPKKTQSTSFKQSSRVIDYSHIYRRNSKIILHYRNIYAFLASVVDELSQSTEEGSELAALIITKRILSMVEWLKNVINSPQPLVNGLDRWKEYKNQTQYLQVKSYIEKEEDIFKVYAQSLQGTVKQKIINGQLGKQARDLIMIQKVEDKLYYQFILSYLKPLIRKITHQTLCTKDFNFYSKQWKHVENVLISLNFQKQFTPKQVNTNQSVFDFTKFYEQKQLSSPQQILLKVEKALIVIC